MMELEVAANALKELGHPIRLTIFKLLVKSGDSGLSVGEIQSQLQMPHSSLSHHIMKLRSVHLIEQKREGRVLRCIPQYDHLDELIHYLIDECCINDSCDSR